MVAPRFVAQAGVSCPQKPAFPRRNLKSIRFYPAGFRQPFQPTLQPFATVG
jgi:hypothetical protein